MLLSLGSRSEDIDVDMTVVTAHLDAGDGGVEHGEALRRFAVTALDATGPDDGALGAARDALRDRVGPAGLGDAACVVANFDAITRVADATGTELDEMQQMGIDAGLLGGLDTSHLRTD